jgi:hypothetical protein
VSRNALICARLLRWICAGSCFCLLPATAFRSAAQPPPAVSATNPASARVIIVSDPGATAVFQPVPEKIQALVDKAVTNFTGKATARAAWLSLVSTNDTVGIKVFSTPGPLSGTRPAVVAAVVQDLLAAGLPPGRIIVWDKRAPDLKAAGFLEFEQRFGIRVKASIDTGYDEKIFYDTPLLGNLIWTDFEFGKKGKGVGRKSYVSKLVSQEITKIINITPMLHHNLVGVSGNLYSLAIGSVDNTARFESDADSLAKAVPELYALPALGDRVVLNIVDALICQYEGQQHTLLQYSTVLNQLRFSRDPVALDVLSLKEIQLQSELADMPMSRTNLDLFSNAALLEIGINEPARIRVEKIP